MLDNPGGNTAQKTLSSPTLDDMATDSWIYIKEAIKEAT